MDILRRYTEIAPSFEYGADLKRIYPVDGARTPFGSALVLVVAGQRTEPHAHHEDESFVITSGTGVFRSNDKCITVTEGDVLYIEAFTEHSIEAATEGDLKFISVWWEPPALSMDCSDPFVIFTPPPTPNGDLHLGHISGPYISADVIKRHLAQRGVTAKVIVGTDKSQSYVKLKARQLGLAPQQVYAGFTKSIMRTFDSSSILYDNFYDCEDPSHEQFTKGFVDLMMRRHLMDIQLSETLYCQTCDHEVFEAFAVGRCLQCGARSNGCVCEDCGTPNNSYDLVSVKCTACDAIPIRRSKPKGILDLGKCAAAFPAASSNMTLDSKLSEYLNGISKKGILKYVVTFESDWGVPCAQPELEGQIYLGWIEMAAGYLSAIYQSLFEMKPKTVEEAIDRINHKNANIIHLMGFDNSFYYAYLYPVLLTSLGLKPLNITFVVNEFLLLSEEKFSTSRNHAIWANDVFTDEISTDWYRFFLSVKKPEGRRENYEPCEFDKFRSDTSAKLEKIYKEHLSRLGDFPFADLYQSETLETTSQYANYIKAQRAKLSKYMSASEVYSVKHYAQAVLEMIDDISTYQAENRKLYASTMCPKQQRELIRVEHVSIKTLHSFLVPLAPNLAQSLAVGV